VLLLLQAARSLPGGYGVALLQSLLALAAVCILAWVVLRWSAKAGLGGAGGRHLEVLERLALDHRRGLVLVRAGKRVLVLGVGEGAAPTLLTELDPGDVPVDRAAKVSFLEVLKGRTEPAKTAPSGDDQEGAA
jgi:flagellar biosynthetic protein FliO